MNHFYKIKRCRRKRSSYTPIEVEWNDIRVARFKEETIKNTSEEQNQEFESVLGSSNTLINPNALRNLAYVHPEYQKDALQYLRELIEGTYIRYYSRRIKRLGIDYSAFTIVDVTEMPLKL